MNAMKIVYLDEIRRISRPSTYAELVELTKQSFKNLPAHFKFFYIDSDEDIISITSEQDLMEALQCYPDIAIKIYVSESNEALKSTLYQSSKIDAPRKSTQRMDYPLVRPDQLNKFIQEVPTPEFKRSQEEEKVASFKDKELQESVLHFEVVNKAAAVGDDKSYEFSGLQNIVGEGGVSTQTNQQPQKDAGLDAVKFPTSEASI